MLCLHTHRENSQGAHLMSGETFIPATHNTETATLKRESSRASPRQRKRMKPKESGSLMRVAGKLAKSKISGVALKN